MPTDDELVEEILSGSQAAMEVLVKRYYKNIFSYIYRDLGDYHTAYDVTQEVFIKMIKFINTYREKGRFKNWLYKIAVNTCLDYYRSRSYKCQKNQVELDTKVSDDKNNVWDMFSRNTEREKIKNAIMELPYYQRDALILKYYHDMKIRDIAKVTGSSQATVKSRLRQGLEKLKRILEGGELDESAGNRF